MREFRIGAEATNEEAQALIAEHVTGQPAITATLYVDPRGDCDIICNVAPNFATAPPANQSILLAALAHSVNAALASNLISNNLADRKTVKHLKQVFDALEQVSDRIGKHIQ